MKISTYIVFLLLLHSCKCINTSLIDCTDLQNIFENEKVINHFYLNENEESFVFVDTFNFFSCRSLTTKTIEIVVSSRYIDELSYGDQSYLKLVNSDERYIVLESFIEVNDGYIIRLWQPNDNATMKVKLKDGDVEVLDWGVY